MPILDLNGAAPLFPKPAVPASRGKRTLGTGTSLAGTSGGQGGFGAAKLTRLTMDFQARSGSADQDLFGDNIRLRARARDLALNNHFAKKFLQMIQQNVVGTAGVLMQAKVKNKGGVDTAQTIQINKDIEAAWQEWGDVGNCSADGKSSFLDLQHMAIKNVGREGENLVKFVYDRSLNRFAFVLQPLDNDQLDDTLIQPLANDGEIRMGVEVNQYRRPVAYHLWNGHPTDRFANDRTRKRIDAADVVHSYISERPSQTRGYTHMSAAILEMNQYSRLNEATMVAVRTAAAKMAVIEQQYDGSYDGDEDEEGQDTNYDGTQVMTANAGEIPIMPVGMKLNFNDPTYPTQAYEPFSRTCIRNIATGLLVSYPTLGNDLAGVNFSSIRAGLLDERDCWRILQRWFIDHFLRPIFQAWLKMALLTVLNHITLTPEQMRQFAWRPRGWDWVDPLKDGDTSVLEIGNGLDTHTAILAEKGLDFEETMQLLKYEQDYKKKLGLILGTDIAGDQAGKGVAAGDEAEAADVEGAAGKGGGK